MYSVLYKITFKEIIIEHPTGVQNVIGSTPVGGTRNFFPSSLCHLTVGNMDGDGEGKYLILYTRTKTIIYFIN